MQRLHETSSLGTHQKPEKKKKNLSDRLTCAVNVLTNNMRTKSDTSWGLDTMNKHNECDVCQGGLAVNDVY